MSGRSMWTQRTSDGRAIGRDAAGRFLPRAEAEADTLADLRDRVETLEWLLARARLRLAAAESRQS